MKLRHLILGTTALVGAGVLATAVASPAAAQQEAQGEVTAAGYPDIEIEGFARFRAHGGELDDQQGSPENSRELDFSNDTEVHINASAVSEQTGLEYGATIEFEADTSRTDNTDETWVYLRGGWGEIRLGDEDGVADNSSVGAQVIAAGTGGIDGSVIDALAFGDSNVYLFNTEDATKIRYYTPSFGGFQLGVSYTPQMEDIDSGGGNGDTIADTTNEAEDVFEGGAVYEGDFGGFGITASVVGIVGNVKSLEATDDDDANEFGDGDWWGWQAGLSTEIFGFKVAGSFADESVGDVERTFFTAGIGYEIGPVDTSITYGQILESDNLFAETGQEVGDAGNLVFSATYALAPGLTLDGDVALFDNDLDGDDDFAGNGVGDQGWSAVGRVALAF